MSDDEEITIDLSKIKNLFKRKKKEERELEKVSSEVKEVGKEIKEDIEKEEIKIKELNQEEIQEEVKLEKLEEDKEKLEQVKAEINTKEPSMKNLEREEKKIETIKEDVDDISKNEISFDLKQTSQKVIKFFKHNKMAVPILLILIAIIFSTFFRMYPANLPITEEWAQNSVNNFYKNQIKSQINQQYPNLPDANKNSLVESQFKDFLKENKDMMEQQVTGTANQFKSQLQYTAENGKDYTYLLAIDPYLWYGYGKNYLECGQAGCVLNEEEEYVTFRNGRGGRNDQLNLVTYFGVWLYKLVNIIGNIPLMYAFFLIPVILIGLSIIPAFFIGKKLGGNLGGFFASMIIAVNSALLSRTPGGFSDTDAANIIFPLFIMWFFLEAVYAQNWKKSSIYSILGGISFYMFTKMWKPYHIFDFLVVATVMYVLIALVMYIKNNHNFNVKKIIEEIKIPVLKSSLFMIMALIFMIMADSLKVLPNLINQIVGFAMMKEVAIKTLWPNVLTTVAEFNTISLNQIINQMGGGLLFFIAILGIIFAVFKKDKNGKHYRMYAALLTIYLLGTAYSFTKGVRFAILMVPAFAVSFGVGVGCIYQFLNKWVSKELKIDKKIVSGVLIVLALLLLLAPIKAAQNVAKNEIPSYNDAWENNLNAITNDAEDGIGYITTWWDFGHWFVAHGNRVTFDGGDQGERIHWVGKSLITESEEESIGILRMLNCGQQEAPHILEKYLEEDTIKSIDVLNKIIVEDKKGASDILEKEGLSKNAVEEVLAVTHCEDLLPQYYIASEDMIGKGGVWGHFGSWDFNRAKMWQTVIKLDYNEGLKVLTEEFNLSEDQADTYYYEIHNTKADQWISPWPGYLSGRSGCNVKNNVAECVVNSGQLIPINVDLETFEATIPGQNQEVNPVSLVYVDGDEVKKKEYEDSTVGFSVLLIPNGNGYQAMITSPLQAYSMFTRMFLFKGHGLEHFDLLDYQRQVTGGEIYTYKIDWDSKDKRDAYSAEPVQEIIEEKLIEVQDDELNTTNENSSEEENSSQEKEA